MGSKPKKKGKGKENPKNRQKTVLKNWQINKKKGS
jgi:hypothetical protein